MISVVAVNDFNSRQSTARTGYRPSLSPIASSPVSPRTNPLSPLPSSPPSPRLRLSKSDDLFTALFPFANSEPVIPISNNEQIVNDDEGSNKFDVQLNESDAIGNIDYTNEEDSDYYDDEFCDIGDAIMSAAAQFEAEYADPITQTIILESDPGFLTNLLCAEQEPIPHIHPRTYSKGMYGYNIPPEVNGYTLTKNTDDGCYTVRKTAGDSNVLDRREKDKEVEKEKEKRVYTVEEKTKRRAGLMRTEVFRQSLLERSQIGMLVDFSLGAIPEHVFKMTSECQSSRIELYGGLRQ